MCVKVFRYKGWKSCVTCQLQHSILLVICVFVCLYACLCACVRGFVCFSVCLRACVRVCVLYACLRDCVCLCVFIHTSKCIPVRRVCVVVPSCSITVVPQVETPVIRIPKVAAILA